MTHPNIHIDNLYSNRLLEYTSKLLGVVSSVVQRERPKTYGTKLIVTLNKALSQDVIYSEGLKNVVKDFTTPKALQEYPSAQKELKRVSSMYSILEKYKFFKNRETQDLAEKVLLNYMDVESILRLRMYIHNDTKKDDSALMQVVSDLSLGSLPI